MTAESAQRLHRWLAQETDYSVAIMTPQGAQYAKPAALAQPELMRQVQLGAFDRAHQGQFSFLYDVHTITQTGDPYPLAEHYLRARHGFSGRPGLSGFLPQP